MTAATHDVAALAAEPMELLRTMLEEEFAAQTARLTELTVYGRLPGHAGYDPHTLDLLATSARERIADTAQALRRMSEGTYGVCMDCHQSIPLGRLRALPHAAYCTLCHRRHGRAAPGGADGVRFSLSDFLDLGQAARSYWCW